MKLMNTGTDSKWWSVAICGILSLFTDFILLPHIFTLITVLGFPIPDPIWISLMILVPVFIAIHMLEHQSRILARYVWVGLPVQYVILIVFAKLMREVSPIASDSWTYIWEAMVWPFSVTVAQFVALIVLRALKVKRGK